jgi:uncharacterized protein YutE (UPF0331/DUF86 family)
MNPHRRAPEQQPIVIDEVENGVFAQEMVHDLRACLTQARSGLDLTERVASFVKDVAGLQEVFANRLARIADKQVLQFAVYNDVDGMTTIRDIFMRTVEESRIWATSTKQMSVSMMRLVGPLQRHHQISSRKLEQVIQENDRLSRPFLEQQTSIVKKQLKCNKMIMPMLNPEFRSLNPRRKEKIMERARIDVVKYLDEVDRANRWVMEVTSIARPKMLNVLQKMEEERIDRTRRILMRYATQLQSASQTMTDIGSHITERLESYHTDDDINTFVMGIRSRPLVDREYLAPVSYRLPISLHELGLHRRAAGPTPKAIPATQPRQHRGREQSDSDSEAPV